MPAPFLATVTILSAAQPKSGGGSTVLAMITPLGGGHADAGLPEAPGAADPGYGHPIGGHPDQGLPWAPGRPDNGVPVPPETWPAQPPPPLPPHLEDQVIVAIHRPGVTEWTVKAYPVPTPKG
jgi:hypothetical protein